MALRGALALVAWLITTAAVALVAALVAGSAVAAGSAGAGSGSGVTPDVRIARDIPPGAPGVRSVRAASERVAYHGGSVLHSSRTHVIFWQPAGSGLTFDAGYEALVGRFLGDVAAASHSTTNIYGLSGQYHDFAGPATYAASYAGAVVAGDPLPENECAEPPTAPPAWNVCLTDAQLQSEIEHVLTADHLPRQGNDMYLLLTPNGFGSCLDSSSDSCALGGSNNGYCGYHSETQSGVLYAVLPYNAIKGHCNFSAPRPNGSSADPEVSTVAHEQVEVMTDPDSAGWFANNGDEIADVCLQHFGGNLGGAGDSAWNEVIGRGHYYLQELWSNDDGGCAPRAAPDRATFSMPRRVTVGKRFTVAARASDPHGAIVVYQWSFAGGAGGRGRRVSHVFRRAGVYRVVLRITDSSGNWAVAARTVRVTRR